jgi:phosphomannomutase
MSGAWLNGSSSIACKNCCSSRVLRARCSFAYTVPVKTIRFGTDGWRGVIADDFTFENVRKVAFAIARYVVRAEKPDYGVIVGYDNRFGSERFARAVAETISMTGVPVWLSTSACPSPAVSLLVRQRRAAGGVMITASHNPYRWNGIKFKASYGSSALPSIVDQIEEELATVQAHGLPKLPPQPGQIQALDILAPYLDTIDKLVDWEKLQAARLRFVVDPMHGAARGLLVSLMRRHGIACEEIRGSRDPLFGGVNPEPIEPHVAALREAIRSGGYDAGFAADGDGDRIGAMHSDGTFITPHQIFSILFWHLAGTRKVGGDLAKTFSTTKLLDKIASHYGRRVHEVPVGFKYICERMLEDDILLGGEESGGIGTKLYLPERDATVSALLLAEVMAWHHMSLGELVAHLHSKFGEHHYGRVDLELRPGQKERAIDYFADPRLARLGDWPVVRREDLDGIKVYISDVGWVMVRASGTEDMLRIYSETGCARDTERLLKEVTTLVQGL